MLYPGYQYWRYGARYPVWLRLEPSPVLLSKGSRSARR
jgi:hypothetical protein